MATTQEEMAWEVYEADGDPIKHEHSTLLLRLHKKIETRINKLQQPVLGLKGGVDRQQVLQIIEEEFGKLDNF